MKILIDAICSVVSFAVAAAVISNLIPNNLRLKKSFAVLSGMICLMLLMPVFSIEMDDIGFNDGDFSEYESDISNIINNRITAAVKAEISKKSESVLRKYKIESVNVTLDAEIFTENGIFVRSVNYIISGSLSSKSTLEEELSLATGYNCRVIDNAEYIETEKAD